MISNDVFSEEIAQGKINDRIKKKIYTIYLEVEQSESNTRKLSPSIMPIPKPSLPNFAMNFKRDLVQLELENIQFFFFSFFSTTFVFEGPLKEYC